MPEKSDFTHFTDFTVRDYECDLQGVVNNSVYQHYLEHARHLFLKSHNIDFAALSARKIFLVVVRAELDYKRSLKPGDTFWVGSQIERISRLKFAFHQAICRYPDHELILRAKVIGTGLNANGRPEIPEEVEAVLIS